MKKLLFFIIFLSLFSYNLAKKVEIKIYNVNSVDEVKKIFKNFKIDKIEEKKNGFKLELETYKKAYKGKSRIKKEKSYYDYLWILVLLFFIGLYFFLTKLAEKLLFLPFDPYEKYKNSVNFLIKKNKKNKKKIFLIKDYFKTYLKEKMDIPDNISNEELLNIFHEKGLQEKDLKTVLNRIEEIKNSSQEIKTEEFNEILDSIDNILGIVECKYEEL